MKYDEIEQDNEVKKSNQDVIEEDCVGEGCYYRMPLDYLQDKRIQADLRLYFYLCNYSNSRGTDVVEASIETMMKRIGITNRKIIFQTLDKLKRRGDIEIIGKRGNVRTIKVRSEKYSLQSENSYSELTNELVETNQSSENSYSELTNSYSELTNELVRTNQSNSENPCKSLEDSTLQTLPEKPNNYINNYNKNKPLNTLYTKYLIGKDNEDKKEDKMSNDDLFSAQALSNNVAPSAPKNNKKEIEDKVLRFCFKDYPYDHYIPKRTVAEWLKDFAPLSEVLKKAVRKHNLTARGIERYGKWNANDMYECNLNLVDRIADDIAEVYYAPIPKTQSNLTKEESKLYEEILLSSSDKAGLHYREYAERYPTEWRKAIYQLRRDYNNGETEHYYISML